MGRRVGRAPYTTAVKGLRYAPGCSAPFPSFGASGVSKSDAATVPTAVAQKPAPAMAKRSPCTTKKPPMQNSKSAIAPHQYGKITWARRPLESRPGGTMPYMKLYLSTYSLMVKYSAAQGRMVGTTTAKPSASVRTESAEAYQYPKSKGASFLRTPSSRGSCMSCAPFERNTVLTRYCSPKPPEELRNMVPRLVAQLSTGSCRKCSRKRGIDCSDMSGTRNVFSMRKNAFMVRMVCSLLLFRQCRWRCAMTLMHAGVSRLFTRNTTSGGQYATTMLRRYVSSSRAVVTPRSTGWRRKSTATGESTARSSATSATVMNTLPSHRDVETYSRFCHSTSVGGGARSVTQPYAQRSPRASSKALASLKTTK